jgi:polyisoprenyl-phosphate glycosyltransferase
MTPAVLALTAPRLPVLGEPVLSVVVPLFNEHENLPELYRRLVASLEAIDEPFELLFVNDGSRDATPAMLDLLAISDPRVTALHMSRNFGHQAAVSAGIDHARGRAVIVMDGDLQDPPEVLARFVESWRGGNDVVYAVRRKRKEGPLKRLGYFAFYRVLRAVADLEIPLDSGDFCLMDRKVVDQLRALPERVRFVRGLRTFVGFRQVGIEYERDARAAGEPKYTFRKLAALAVDGILNHSGYPLRLVTYLGLLSAAAAALLASWAVWDAISNQSTPRGWASLIVVMLFMGAIQLVSLGVVGEYVRRIFLEVKGRPTYIVGRVAQSSVGLARFDQCAGVSPETTTPLSAQPR